MVGTCGRGTMSGLPVWEDTNVNHVRQMCSHLDTLVSMIVSGKGKKPSHILKECGFSTENKASKDRLKLYLKKSGWSEGDKGNFYPPEAGKGVEVPALFSPAGNVDSSGSDEVVSSIERLRVRVKRMKEKVYEKFIEVDECLVNLEKRVESMEEIFDRSEKRRKDNYGDMVRSINLLNSKVGLSEIEEVV